ncbi:DUF975 family protein [Phocaeicola sp.]
MKRNSEYRNQAVDALTGNWVSAAVITLVYAVIMGIFGMPSQIAPSLWTSSFNLISILLLPLTYGYGILFLNLIRGTKPDLGPLFDGFKDFGRIFLTLLLQGVYILLWTLLLFIPGIIKAYSYRMTVFILKDEPALANNAAIERSMAMMQGHKMKLFLLDLSFIGWAILCCFTLGIGFLFLTPYMSAAHAAFYEDVKKEYEAVVG